MVEYGISETEDMKLIFDNGFANITDDIQRDVLKRHLIDDLNLWKDNKGNG